MNEKQYKLKQRKLSRYFHTLGYGRLAGGFKSRKKQSSSGRFRLVYLFFAIAVLLIGIIYIF